MLNVFIEGIPGSGKSTLLSALQKNFPAYNFYYEGDISPIELAWCSYMTHEQYKKAIKDWTQLEIKLKENSKTEDSHYIVSYTRIHTDNHDFYRYMEQYELYGGRRNIKDFSNIVFKRFRRFNGAGNVFECAFFQNIIEELMLFAEYDDSQIYDFYSKMITNIQNDFFVIRLLSTDIENSIKQIKEERKNVTYKYNEAVSQSGNWSVENGRIIIREKRDLIKFEIKYIGNTIIEKGNSWNCKVLVCK